MAPIACLLDQFRKEITATVLIGVLAAGRAEEAEIPQVAFKIGHQPDRLGWKYRLQSPGAGILVASVQLSSRTGWR